MSYSQVTLVGRLGRDPEVRMTANGKQIVTASMAVGRDDKTVWFKIQAWEKTGEWLKSNSKGDMVFVQGGFEVRSFDRKDGSKGLEPLVNAQAIRSMGKKDGITSSDSFDDIPF